ncbi:hypothetical protein HYALB_00003883 [Hymenoscyphus albidus]|uniref:Aminoacyl-transfer RNA synthetases class-II family profile domain-containing protein n=1 Tax=Hymenoscyphus albidus TaxID=595503 RepID=A0A9N9Q661_9HELO|nr:hypothetical protein HYALB_00003883 [Hymenoscyphus albidus]
MEKTEFQNREQIFESSAPAEHARDRGTPALVRFEIAPSFGGRLRSAPSLQHGKGRDQFLSGPWNCCNGIELAMTRLSIAARFTWRRKPRVLNPSSVWAKNVPCLANTTITSLQRRCFHHNVPSFAPEGQLEATKEMERPKFWEEYKGTYHVTPPDFPFENQIPLALLGQEITTVGHLSRLVQGGPELFFATISKGAGPESIQCVLRDLESNKKLHSIRFNSAISVTGTLQQRHLPKNRRLLDPVPVARKGYGFLNEVEIVVKNITCLNSFGEAIPSSINHVYPATARHLQIRFDQKLRDSLLFRSEVTKFARLELGDFHEIETPILFKSTPEGAREFLVPTRRPGFTYALPQSPQQYKQMLMASGINRYVQFARCFRDEDLRADRQPEFTQIDLEMAWTDGEGVMQRVERFIKSLYGRFAEPETILPPLSEDPFLRMTYDEAMSKHGSDKPDLRIPGLIHRVDHLVPAQLRSMITPLEDPIIEAYKINLDETPTPIKTFLKKFFASTERETFAKNPDGGPGIFVHDPSKVPLEGLQAFGFEGAEAIKQFYETLSLSPTTPSNPHAETPFGDGDLLLLQARPNLPHTGGSTALGNLRRAIYKAAIAAKLIYDNPIHQYLWVTDFPMFTPENSVDPGQEGSAGFSTTHHPFTAPKTAEDVDLLLTDPLKAKADHYDLVVNGVELGGGSKRIHNKEMQEFVMRDVLKMSPQRIQDFSHLLQALDAGCPPHAGLAIGLDRLIAVMRGVDSVRDVIAFPKNSKGNDLTVGSPRKVGGQELGRYGLCVAEGRRGKNVVVERVEREGEGDGHGDAEAMVERPLSEPEGLWR